MSQFLLASLYYTAMVLILKILIQDAKKWLGDVLYFLPIVIVGSLALELTHVFVLGNILVLFCLALFLYFVKEYLFLKAMFLTLMAYLMTTLITNGIGFVIVFLLPNLWILPYPRWLIYTGYFIVTNLVSPIGISFLLVKFTLPFRERINQDRGYQLTLFSLLLILALSIDNILLTFRYRQANLGGLFMWLLLSVIVFVFPFFIGTDLHLKSMENKLQAKQKEQQQQDLLRYTNEIERQSVDMRKFKHDYQNILASFGSFIIDDDMKGLKAYFEKQVKVISKNITEQDLTLSNLEKVKIKEVKSIFVSKVITAYEHGILVTLEIKDEITQLNVNTATLVRMLGIILDNAIEEVNVLKTTNPTAAIAISLFKDEETTTIIVSNNCCSSMESLHVLKKEGYSTKGENRGLGLSNLAELAQEEEAVLLQTLISDDTFTQIITIGR